jgi:hypothetical protein
MSIHTLHTYISKYVPNIIYVCIDKEETQLSVNNLISCTTMITVNLMNIFHPYKTSVSLAFNFYTSRPVLSLSVLADQSMVPSQSFVSMNPGKSLSFCRSRPIVSVYMVSFVSKFLWSCASHLSLKFPAVKVFPMLESKATDPYIKLWLIFSTSSPIQLLFNVIYSELLAAIKQPISRQDVLGRTNCLLSVIWVPDITSREKTLVGMCNEVNKTIQFGKLQCWYYWWVRFMKCDIYMTSGGMIYIPTLINISLSITIKVITSKTSEAIMLILLTGVIYKFWHWGGVRCHDIQRYVHNFWDLCCHLVKNKLWAYWPPSPSK